MNPIQPLSHPPVRFGAIRGRIGGQEELHVSVSDTDYDQFQSLCVPNPEASKKRTGEIVIYWNKQLSFNAVTARRRDDIIDLILPHTPDYTYPEVAADKARRFTRQSLEAFKQLIARIPSIDIDCLILRNMSEAQYQIRRLSLQESLKDSLMFTLLRQAGYEKALEFLGPKQ